MATVTDIVTESLELYNDSIKETMNDRNMDATRVARNSLKVVQNGNIISSEGVDYIEYLNRGRPPGKFPPMDVIARWIDLKGLQIDPYVIARNIAENGTRIYRNRELGLKLEDKTEALEDDLNKKLPTFVNNQIVTAINEALKG